MKRMRAVESDSVKSARKAKDKLYKPFKERQKLVSELCTGRNKTECAWHASMRESRDSDRFLVNTQVQSHALLRRGFGTSVPFIKFIADGHGRYGSMEDCGVSNAKYLCSFSAYEWAREFCGVHSWQNGTRCRKVL